MGATEILDTGIVVLSWVCLIAGSFFSVVGGIGIVRLPEFYSRMHGGGVTDTLGAGLIVLGLLLIAGFSLTAFKLLTILFFLTVTSPSSCHALARSALIHGLRPVLDPSSQQSAQDDPATGEGSE